MKELTLHKMELPLTKYADLAAVESFLQKNGYSGGEIVKGRSAFIVKGVAKDSFIESTLKAITDEGTGVVTYMGRLKKSVRDALAADAAEDDETSRENFQKGEGEDDETAEGDDAAAGDGEEGADDADAEAGEEDADGGDAEGSDDAEGEEDEDEDTQHDGDEVPTGVEKGMKGGKSKPKVVGKKRPGPHNDGKGSSQPPAKWAEKNITGKPVVLKGSVGSVLAKFDSWHARTDKDSCSICKLLDSNPDPTPPGLQDINAAFTVALSNIMRKGVNVTKQTNALLKEHGMLVGKLVEVFSAMPDDDKAEVAKSVFFGDEDDSDDSGDSDDDGEDSELEKGEYEDETEDRVAALEEENADLEKEVSDLRKQVEESTRTIVGLRSLEARLVKLEGVRQRRQSAPETPPEEREEQSHREKVSKAEADRDAAFAQRARGDALGITTRARR